MKIVIIGAGIAGCAVYLELRKHLPRPTCTEEGKKSEHDITIYEEYSTALDDTDEDRDIGSVHSTTLLVGGGLGVGANGLGVLERLDQSLLQGVTRGGHVISHYNFRTKDGQTLMRLAPWESDDPSPLLSLGTTRHSLWRNLRAMIPDRDIVRARVAEVVAHADRQNEVRFADGRDPVEADLVVGADGIWSKTKRALFPDGQQSQFDARYEGLVGVGGFLPADDFQGLVEPGSINFVFGGNGFFGYYYGTSAASAPHGDSPYHISKPGNLLGWWSSFPQAKCPDRRSLDMDPIHRQLFERHANWKDPVIQRVIRSAKFRSMYPTWTTPPLPTWERDGVVLLGDAAHALPPTSGQGSSQALEDSESFALFLSHHLRKEGASEGAMRQKEAIRAAANQYIALRKPRVEQLLQDAQKAQEYKRNMSGLREHLMYLMMQIMGFFPYFAGRTLRKVNCYNVAEHVARVLVSEE